MEGSGAAGRDHAPEYLLEAGAFRELLAHERACSERSGAPFSVLAFEAGREPGAENALVAAIVARVRATDALGWLEDGRLGVLLRYASVTDALRVAHQVRQRAGAPEGAAVCTVHGYPPFERGSLRESVPVSPVIHEAPHALEQHDPS
ncbi:MAG TPA: hypothetical protein VF530_04480 [Planctomycetota bacterium]